MWGRDWPITVPVDGYAGTLQVMSRLVGELSYDEQPMILRGTATSVHQLHRGDECGAAVSDYVPATDCCGHLAPACAAWCARFWLHNRWSRGDVVLTGIHPLLTGDLLAHLDAMGHSDAVVLADAHFPADRLARRLLIFPGLSTTAVLAAIRSVVPLDDAPSLDLMETADGSRLPVQDELAAAAGVPEGDVRFLPRQDFYAAAAEAHLIVRTGETRTYGNAILRKGVVPVDARRS